MATLGLSQMVLASIHKAGHMLDLIFCAGIDQVTVVHAELVSLMDHYFLNFELRTAIPICLGKGLIYACLQRLKDPTCFQNALQDLLKLS